MVKTGRFNLKLVKIGKKLLFPSPWIVAILSIICSVALVKIFVNGWEMTILAYISYVLSFYTFSVLCIGCWKVLPVYYVIFGNSNVCSVWCRHITGSKENYDYANRSRDLCGGCIHGSLYDCTDIKRDKKYGRVETFF